MKVEFKRLYFPVFYLYFTNQDRIETRPYGQGHDTIEEAFTEGLLHTEKFPKGEVLREMNQEVVIRNFRWIVTEQFVWAGDKPGLG